MAQSNKTLITFTAGEWGKRLHGRTDLANADAAGRKVRNMVVAQYGRVKRRVGLDFIGAALGECFPGDPRFEIPTWSGLDEEVTFTPVDVYGAKGPEELRTSPVVGPVWQVCKNVAYCWGPTEQAVPMPSVSDRYRTRWVAKIEDGFIYYRRVGTGEAWRSVSNDLVAQPHETLNGLGFCFDANAMPAFASQIGSNIHVWRYQAGTPTEETFPGAGPRLFFDGTIQYDHENWDIVCYFCWNGDLVAAFQREGFDTNYTLFSSEDYYFTRVNLIEIGDSERLYIAASGQSSLYGLFRTRPFPPWPIIVEDRATATVGPVTGIHMRVLVDIPVTYDAADITIGPVTGVHRAAVVQVPEASDSAAVTLGTVTGIHKLVLVQVPGTYSDTAAVTLGPATGIHKFTLIQAGSYSDSASVTVGPVTGVHAHV